ncbi:hypothetical protein Tco_0956656 [Tanacetum coccineum]
MTGSKCSSLAISDSMGVGVSTEGLQIQNSLDLTSAWSQLLRHDGKGSTASSSSTQNVAFVSENTSSTNDVSTAYSASNPSGQNSQIKGNQDNRRRDAWNSKNKDGSRTGKKEDSKALVTIDGEEAYMKEKEDLKLSREDGIILTKNLGKLLNTQMSANDKFRLGESETQTSDFDTRESDYSVETHESLPEATVNEPKVVSQPKVWSDAPIIEEYESDSEDEHVSLPTEEQETPSFANQQVKTPRQTVIEQNICNQSLKPDKKDCSGLMSKKMGLGFGMCKESSQREVRLVWNNVQRMNHQNLFVPKAVLTRAGKILVNTARASGINNVSTARHNFNSQAVLTNAARKISTVKPFFE